MYKSCETTFNIDRHLIVFLQEIPFFAEISRHIRKQATKDLPTAAVSFNPKTDELVLYWNPDFFTSLSNWEIRGVLTHELYHLVFGHLNGRRRTPHKLWNISTDLAINSIIVGNAGQRKEDDKSDARPLPKCALVPGQWPTGPDGREMTKEEKEAHKLAALIATMPTMQASEWYYNKLQDAASKDEQLSEQLSDDGGGYIIIDSMDDHDGWDSVPEDKREYVEGKIKAIIEKAVRKADQQANGWGNIPSDMQGEIRRSVSNIVNWRAVLRQFVGSLVRGERSTSIKRINRRYPYIHPGVKRAYQAKLIIAIDESGSVYDEMLEMFFAELGTLTKNISVTILPFDCYADIKDSFEWDRGTAPRLKRTKCGGTDFDAPTRVVNDPKNRGQWDGFLIMTDGQAPAPQASRVKRGWVLGKGCSIEFASTELQVKLDDGQPMTGAWR